MIILELFLFFSTLQAQESLRNSHFESPFALPDQPLLSETKLETSSPDAAQSDLDLGRLLREGIELARAGHLVKAEEVFREAVKIAPDSPKAWNNLGLVLRRRGKVDDAIAAYHQATRADPNFALTYKNVGILLEEQKEYSRAAKALRKYSSMAPEAPDAAAVQARAARLEKETLESGGL